MQHAIPKRKVEAQCSRQGLPPRFVGLQEQQICPYSKASYNGPGGDIIEHRAGEAVILVTVVCNDTRRQIPLHRKYLW